MGRPLAGRLLAAGHDVTVWSPSGAVPDGLVVRGARAAATPGLAAAEADVAVVMVATPAAVEATVLGPQGLVASEVPVVAQLSTIGPGDTRQLAAELAGRSYLDAPVVGGVDAAAAGSLRLLVGAARADYEQWAPFLEALGTPVHVGTVGTGSSLKLVLNAATAPMMALLAEALLLGDRLGLDETTMLDELARSRLGPLVQRKREQIEQRTFPADNRLRHFAKDLDLASATARDHSIRLDLVEAARWLARQAVAAGRGDEDYAALVAFVRQRMSVGSFTSPGE